MNETNAAEELAFIKNIISESRRSFALSGKPYIFWGILIVIGLLMEFLREIEILNFAYTYYVWIVLIAIGWGYAYFERKKCRSEINTSTLTGKILGAVWLSCGISMTIYGFLGTLSGAIKGIYISPGMSILLAIAYFVTGVIYDYKWLRNISIGWWAGGIFMFFFPGNHTELTMALMMILFQIVPGIVLYKKSKDVVAAAA